MGKYFNLNKTATFYNQGASLSVTFHVTSASRVGRHSDTTFHADRLEHGQISKEMTHNFMINVRYNVLVVENCARSIII